MMITLDEPKIPFSASLNSAVVKKDFLLLHIGREQFFTNLKQWQLFNLLFRRRKLWKRRSALKVINRVKHNKLDLFFWLRRTCSCNCGLSSNSPFGKIEPLNQSGPLNHKSHFSSLVGGIPLVPQSAGFSRPLTKFQCTLESALEFIFARLTSQSRV
ncbi:hypothetical protein TNIN_203561 [Trichonephila inaurata madagascariensis]|uniref:Uncharacterized protein n=1 Tax=Trichonephila inaurata madagascariensis TaxID=2747483 RepID=A0A8X6WW04_9ARAC|nr:hypothetical protein TNIN_203561 [Trichonephila inaurata madagascariensis]